MKPEQPVKPMLIWRRYRALVTVLLLTLIAVLLVRTTSLQSHFTLDALRHDLAENHWRGVVLFTLLFVAGNLLHIPGLVFLIAAVMVLGRTEGALVTYIAASLSCCITFFGVRAIGGDALARLSHPLALRLLAHLHRAPLRIMVLLRTVFQTMPTLNYTLAMSGVGFWKYALATLLGLPLPISLYCLFFDYVARAAGLQ